MSGSCGSAELLRLTPMLKRRPNELSGGQQQRTATRPRAGQGRRPGSARRAARQPRLQAARGAARGAAALLRRPELHRRLRDHRAYRGAAALAAIRPPCTPAASPSSAKPPTSTATRRTSSAHGCSPTRRSIPPKSKSVATRCSSATSGCLSAAPRAGIPDGTYIIGIRPHHITPSKPNAEAAADRRHGGDRRTLRLGERRPLRSRRPDLGLAVAGHPSLRGGFASRRLYVDMDHALFFDLDDRRVERGRMMARITLEDLRHSYLDEPAERRGLGAASAGDRTGRTAAPMPCSARRAAARPRSSTSSPA